MKRISLILSVLVLAFSLSHANESADAMVARISAKLSAAPKSLENIPSLDVYNIGLTSLLAELSLFEVRYGMKPEETKGWAKVKTQSLSLLGKLEAAHRKPKDIVTASTRVLLLELCGRYNEALRQYPTIKTDAFCGDWMMSVTQQNDLRRSSVYEKMGDKKKALESLDSALAARKFSFCLPNPDIHYVRHGLLSLNEGNVSAGVADLQKVVDLYPNTLGSEIAKEQLVKINKLIVPTAARLKEVYLSASSDYYMDALEALSTHKFADSFETLCTLLDSAPPLLKNRVIAALGRLGDKRGIAVLLADFRRGSDFEIQLCELAAMGQLGDYTLMRPFFERITQAKPGESYPLGFINDRFRVVFNGGPKFTTFPDFMKAADFSTQWMAWLQANAPAAITPVNPQKVTGL